jgi:membrane protein required for beta-lactamase induction
MSLDHKRTKRTLKKAAVRLGLTEGSVIAEAFYAWVQALAKTSSLSDTPREAASGIFRVLAVVILRLVGVLYVLTDARKEDLLTEYQSFIMAVHTQLYDGLDALQGVEKEAQDELPS